MPHAPRWSPSILVVALLAPACMVIVGGRSGAADEHYDEHADHGPLCAAIDVASAVAFSGDRAQALREIAARTDLDGHEQMFLIDVAVDGHGFSSDVADVLVALAQNPSLTPAAREHLGRRSHAASLFPSDRRRLATALARAGRAPAADDASSGGDGGGSGSSGGAG